LDTLRVTLIEKEIVGLWLEKYEMVILSAAGGKGARLLR
jgi:hypothetical protein